MAGNWYFARNGQRFGPFAFEQFRQMATSGLLAPSDMVQEESQGRWQSAEGVPGLFPGKGTLAPERVAPPPPAPHQEPTFTQQSAPNPATPAPTGKSVPSSNHGGAIAGIILMAIIFWVLKSAGCLPEDFSTPFDRNAGKRVAQEVATANAISVSAEGLTQEGRSNDIATDQKYKGKVLEVSGTVVVVRGGSSGVFASKPYIQLAGIRCEFNSNTQIQHLNAGQFVTVRGKYQGGGVLRYCGIRQ